MKYVAIGIALIAGIIAIGWGLTANDLVMYQFFAPKRAVIQREVFENTPSYQLGNLQNLRQDVADYNRTTDPAIKQTIQAALQTKVNGLPPNFSIPSDVQTVLNDRP